MLQQLLLVSAGLLTFVTPGFAQLPYNPARIVLAQNDSVAYVFAQQPSSSQFSLSRLNISGAVSSTPQQSQLFSALPFLSETDPTPFVAIPDQGGITVLAGDCNGTSSRDLELWRFTFDDNFTNGTWSTLTLTSADRSLRPQFLSAGFTFPPTASVQNAKRYIFGGMCPDRASTNATSWVSSATYSNTMLTVTPGGGSAYQLSWTGARAPPIPEAGLTITPLNPTLSNTSTQQNFVLVGGHTQNAFINMSQVAIFSLPEEAWAFATVSQAPTSGSSSSPILEPRSGHSAILSEDGSSIVILGGWVGDIGTPAEPQLMVLQLGQGFGGVGDWTWTVPSSQDSPFPSGVGLYGHAVAMLPGGVMMVSGGYSIRNSGSRNKRQLSRDLLFLNTTSFSWMDAYENPNQLASGHASGSSQASQAGLSSSERAGLGAGIGLGLAAALGVALVWLFYSRKLRNRRAIREKELRELALGAERYHATPRPGEDDLARSGMRTASWGDAQEKKIESSGSSYLWPSLAAPDQNGRPIGLGVDGTDDNNSRHAERTGVQMELPSPTRGLRKGLGSRGPGGYGPFNQHPPNGPGSVFRIDEEDEGSQTGSFKRAKTPSVLSDPFKDPPHIADGPQPNHAAVRRKREVEGWVEDWQSAAESMSVSRSTSQAQSRTYSNLSQFRPQGMASDASGRGSPEKSDRTGSNLSDNSIMTYSSRPKSIATTLTHNPSQRSTSAGYSLFTSAVAAMGRFGNIRQGHPEHDANPGLLRAPSNRSASLNTDSSRQPGSSFRDRTETFSSARSGWVPSVAGDDHTLLNRSHQRQPDENRLSRTLSESPSKEKHSQAGSITGSGRKAMTLLGSVKRVFTGTGAVDVPERVAGFEGQSGHSSPTKHTSMPEMTQALPRRTLSAGASFWRSKQGAKDWESDVPGQSNADSSSTIHRKPVPGTISNVTHGASGDEDDWDVESAIQRRLVQVMFTVPKEKLRVVNADALSLLSSTRSEGDFEEDRDKDPVKRMSSVNEGNEDHEINDDEVTGKGKDRAG